MGQTADFAATAPFRGVLDKPEFFPTNLASIAQSAAVNGQVVTWDAVRRAWVPRDFEGTVSVNVGSTTTGAPGSSAAVTNSGTPEAVVLDFTIPRGDVGAPGSPGSPGAPGSPGTPGAVWYAGSGAPSGGLGVNGDFYLNATNGDVYEKISGTWTVVANIKGPAGSGSGTVTSVTIAGRGISSSPNPIVATGTITGFDPDRFNVLDYGADRTGAADSITAINSAVTALLAAGGGCLYFPSGTYQMSTKLLITQTANNQSVRVCGDGTGVTKLYWPTTDGLEIVNTALEFEGATTSNSVTVEDFSLCAGTTATKKGLKITGKNNNGSESGCLVRRLTFEGYTSGKWWGDVIHLDETRGFNIEDISSIAGSFVGDGILLTSSTGQTLGSIKDVLIQGHENGLHSTGNNAYEGIKLSRCTFSFVKKGIFWDTTSGEEELHFTDSYVLATEALIVVNNCERVFISGCNLTKDGTGTFVGIDINSNCNWAQIFHNFIRVGSADVAIDMDSGNHTIVGNTMQGPSTGIVLNAACVDSLVMGNQNYNSAGSARGGTCVTDNGTGNQVVNNF